MGRSRVGFRRPANGRRRASGREQQRVSWQARHRTRSSAIRMPRVEGGRQRPARRQMLPRKQASSRLPRMEGLPRCSRLTQKYEPHPKNSITIDIRYNKPLCQRFVLFFRRCPVNPCCTTNVLILFIDDDSSAAFARFTHGSNTRRRLSGCTTNIIGGSHAGDALPDRVY